MSDSALVVKIKEDDLEALDSGLRQLVGNRRCDCGDCGGDCDGWGTESIRSFAHVLDEVVALKDEVKKRNTPPEVARLEQEIKDRQKQLAALRA